MAKILKCPRCQEKIDVTDLSGGSTVKCEACGTMVRLASGSTGKVPQVPAPPPPPPPPPARKDRGTTKMHKKERGTSRVGPGPTAAGRQTDLFRKMSNAKSPGEGGRPRGGGGEKQQGSNTGMIIAIAAAVLVIIGGAAFALMKGGGEHAPAKGSGAEAGASSKSKKKKDEPKPRPLVSQPIQAQDNSVFRPGARGMIDKATTPTMPNLTQDGRTAYESLVSSKVADVVAQDFSWITYVIDGMLSDNETVAKGSMEAMHHIIKKHKLDSSQSDLGKNPNIGGFNMPEMRSGEYTYWAQWYFTVSARNAVASWASESGGSASSGGGDSPAPRVAAGNPATEAWEETLRKCRSGGFTNSSNPEYYEFQRIKGMGKSAYPHLVRFIDHEDTSLGTAAVLILKELSGRSEQPSRVTEANKAKIKEEWEGWLKAGP
jgi:hypothetical protein